MQITSAAATHIGQRNNNEDAYACDARLGLFAVADGMGGYEGGEVASRLTVEALTGLFRRQATDAECTWPFGIDPRMDLDQNLLAVAVHAADEAIRCQRRGRLGSMGSTVAALAVRGRRAVIAHVGDSRVYRLRDGTLEALTRDHSLYAEMVAAGMPVGTRESFPHANVITRALGMKGCARPDLRTEDLRPGDVFLLCSDGMEPVAPEDIVRLIDRRDPGAAAESLVQTAFARGGKDNITAVVVRVE